MNELNPGGVSCQSCIYFRANRSWIGVDRCHRYPPAGEDGGSWSTVKPNDFCGEWKRKLLTEDKK